MNARIMEELENHWDADLGRLLGFLKIPSVSGEPAMADRVAEAAAYLKNVLAAEGFSASVEPTGGHPAVLASWTGAPGAPTLLVYGHYDVQPAKADDGWRADPFAPRVKGGAIYARGATDDKGQLWCHLMGAFAHLRSTGKLPVNIKMIFEGEEESGSVHLAPYLAANRERLAADVVVVSDTAQYAAGKPALTYGLRGLLCMELKIKGPNRDLHSGSFGGAAANPANALSRIISHLTDSKGRVAVEGFYDRVRPLEAAEREEWAGLGFDEEALADALGVPALTGEEGFTALERMWARPTFDVNGLWSGHQGKGPKTIIPFEAGAKLSFRLVPDQDPEEIAALIERRIERLAPEGVRVELTRQHGAKPVLLPRAGRAVEAAARAVEAGFGVKPVMIREGGSIPVIETFVRLLGAPVVLMGFGRPDDRAHGPDERFHLADLKSGAISAAHFYSMLAGADSAV